MGEYNSYSDLWRDLESDYEYLTEKNILEFTLQLYQLMEKRGVTKTELAEAIDSSQAYITKVFKGNANFTVATMTKLANAIDGQLSIHVTGKEEKRQRWFRAIDGRRKPIPKWNKTDQGIRSSESDVAGQVA